MCKDKNMHEAFESRMALTRHDFRWQNPEPELLVSSSWWRYRSPPTSRHREDLCKSGSSRELEFLCVEMKTALGMFYRNRYHNRNSRSSDLSPLKMLIKCQSGIVRIWSWRHFPGGAGTTVLALAKLTGSEAY